MKKSLLFLLFGLLTLSIAFGQKKEKELPPYSEDLSATRPRYNPDDTRPKDIKPAGQQRYIKEVPAENEKMKSMYCVNDTLRLIIDSLAQKNIKILYTPGYRIQVYNGNNKDEISKLKTKIYTKLPDIDIYTTFRQPDYKVKFGDFKTKIEAYQAMGSLKEIPEAIIVPDQVNINK